MKQQPKQGKRTGVATGEFRFTKDELAILDPLDRKKREIHNAIQKFVTEKVVPRLYPDLESNRKYRIQYDIQKNSVRIKDMNIRQDLTKENWKDVLSMGSKTPAR